MWVRWYLQISHQAEAYVSFFFFKVDRWSDTTGSELSLLLSFCFNLSTAGYLWIHDIFLGAQRHTVFYWGIKSGL